MIDIQKHILDNGLRVIVHPDHSTPMAAVNIIYHVGAKDENPDRTGIAHLFEHLMFGGSKNIPSFDKPLQIAGGENNAFTSNDITNYYETLPSNNIETAFWLESDRMLELDFSERSLEIQKNVVVEEFKQRYLNQPYGDMPLLYRPLAYKVHPYQWPTIGKNMDHIKTVSLDEIKDFFFKHYAPDNAVLCVTGNVNADDIFRLSEKWFGPIPKRNVPLKKISQESEQTEERWLEVENDVPNDLIQISFHMGSRKDENYYTVDLMSDILSHGNSSRLYQSLIMKQQLFTDINAYITGDDDPGLVIIKGKPAPGISLDKAREAIWSELTALREINIEEYELQKVKNKVESNLIYSEISYLNKAMTLSHFELLSKAEDINFEAEKYRTVNSSDIKRMAETIFRPENSSTIFYKVRNKSI